MITKPTDEGFKKGYGVQFVVDEAKFNKSSLRITKIDGPQMSDRWIKGIGRDAERNSRIYNALIAGGYSEEAAAREEAKVIKALNNGEVDRVLTHVSPDGTVTRYRLDKNGKKIKNGKDYVTWP